MYTWQNVGVIDYDADTKLWLVQKLSADERVLDENGKPIINKAFKPDGTSNFYFYFLFFQVLENKNKSSFFKIRFKTIET